LSTSTAVISSPFSSSETCGHSSDVMCTILLNDITQWI
jgi:hypothetical protein